ncbi:MAG: hypothetical protein LM589_02400 [Thermosphaera sp.]|nr:hypothetical protein [Thermosphaera sp.]
MGSVEIDREGLMFLYNGVRRLKQYLIVAFIVLILGFILAIVLVLAIPPNIEAIMESGRIPVELIIVPALITYILELIPTILYYHGARSSSKCFGELYGYAKASLLLLLISLVLLPIGVLTIYRVVDEANRILSTTQSWASVRVYAEKVGFVVWVVGTVKSIIGTVIAIYLVQIFRDLGELFISLLTRIRGSEESASSMLNEEFALKLRDATNFLTWSYVVGFLNTLFSIIAKPFLSSLSGILSIIAIILYIIGLGYGYKGLSEIESVTEYYILHA